jgi:4-hydroxythreonine-4-phosphate dehydrogenase
VDSSLCTLRIFGNKIITKKKLRKKLRIGITIGDVNGIGPELIVAGLHEIAIKEMFTPVVYGSAKVLNAYRKVLDVEKFSYNVIQKPNQAAPRKLSLIDCIPGFDRVDIGKPSPESGLGAYQALAAAVADMKEGELDALVTLPIDKNTIQGKDFDFPGHTEYLAKAFGASDSLMFMVSDRLRVGTVTGHIPLKDVASSLSLQKILSKIRLMNHSLRDDFNIERPRIAVLGLNPHAGDNGLIGTEDRDMIAKAIRQAGDENIIAVGPYSADGFFSMRQFTKFDAILAMYHDQGLIPFKLLAGFEGVNYTAGLPIIRTSPDHGVAYDLAGKGIASPESFYQAIYMAIDLYRNRFENLEIRTNKLGEFKEVISPVDEVVTGGDEV